MRCSSRFGSAKRPRHSTWRAREESALREEGAGAAEERLRAPRQSGTSSQQPPAPRSVQPPDQSGRALQAAGGVTTTMPRCFVQATPRVQQYLLRAGVVSALDLAGWWCSLEEVRAHGVSLGWDVADLQGAQVAWSESHRPEVRSLPNVPVPGGAWTATDSSPALPRSPHLRWNQSRRPHGHNDVVDMQTGDAHCMKRKGTAAPGPQ